MVLPAALRRLLILPPLLPIVIGAAAYAMDLAGYEWNVHGNMIGLVALFFAAVIVAAAVMVYALVKAVPAVVRLPESRTTADILYIVAGMLFVAICLGALLRTFW